MGSSEMHEATRRLLGVLLRQMDGFGPQSRSIIIGATNRRQDLDPALLSRFDASVTFGYPSEECRWGPSCLLKKSRAPAQAMLPPSAHCQGSLKGASVHVK